MKVHLISYILVIYVGAVRGQYFQHGETHNSYESNNYGEKDHRKGPTSGSIVVPVAFTKHHPIEYVDYQADDPDTREPQTIQVQGGNIPLNIIFSPKLNHLSVADSDDHSFRDDSDQRYTYSEEEPIVTYHEVNTPVFQEQNSYQMGYEDNPNNQHINEDQNWHQAQQENENPQFY